MMSSLPHYTFKGGGEGNSRNDDQALEMATSNNKL
jgi:hypothetical protein